jgi:hypothetical protein
MRARAILIAAAILVVALGGGAVLVAANDKDDPSATLFSSSDETTREPAPATPGLTTPEATAPETQPAPSTAPDQSGPEQNGAPTIEEDGGEPTTMEPAPAPSSEPSGPARRTHFKREPKGAERNDAPDREFAVPPARVFTGEGNARLGTVDVKATSILKWRTKGRFEVHFGREDFPIIAPTSTGQLVLPPFRFEEVRVIAKGRWRITVRPQ